MFYVIISEYCLSHSQIILEFSAQAHAATESVYLCLSWSLC